MLSIPLGTYGLELAEIVRDKFNEQRNKYPERHPMRLRAHITFRGRGSRKLWKRVTDNEGLTRMVRVCDNFDEDLPLEYATRVALYLKINLG